MRICAVLLIAVALVDIRVRVSKADDQAIDLMPLIDLKSHGTDGAWVLLNGVLSSAPGKESTLVLPYTPPSDYELTLTIPRGDPPVIGLYSQGRQFPVVFNWRQHGGLHSGIAYLDGVQAVLPEARYEGDPIPASGPYKVQCVVRRDRVTISVASRTIVDWRGEHSRLRPSIVYTTPNKDALYLGVWDATFVSGIKLKILADAGTAATAEGAALDPARRLPVPSANELEKANAELEKVLGAEIAAASTAARQFELAGRVLQLAVESAEPRASYALARRASELAIGAEEVSIAFRAIDQIAVRFEVDALEEKSAALASLLKSAREPRRKLALAMIAASLADEAIAQDEFDFANQLCLFARSAALAGRDTELAREMLDLRGKAQRLREEFALVGAARETLAASPDDAKAKGAIGRYYCLIKGQWSRGLPMLALSDDDALRKLAALELEGPAAAEQWTTLADGWWELADAATDERAAANARERAVQWYAKALPSLLGLSRARAEQRIEQFNRESQPKPPRHVPEGAVYWNHCWYWFSEGKMSFQQAAELARRAKGRLVVVSSDAENAFVAERLKGPTFLGLARVEGAWMNALGLRQEFFRWDRGQPSVNTSPEKYAAIHPHAAWHDVPPSNLHVCIEWGRER